MVKVAALLLVACGNDAPRATHRLPMTGVPVCERGYLSRAVFVSAGDASWGYTGERAGNGLVHLARAEQVHFRFGLCPATAPRERSALGCTMVQVEWYAEATLALEPAALAPVALPRPPSVDCVSGGVATLSAQPI